MPIPLDDTEIAEHKQQAITWLVRLRADDLTDHDMRLFADWLARDCRHSEAFAFAEDLFDDMVCAVGVAATPAADSIDQTAAPAPVVKFQSEPSGRAQHAAFKGKAWLSAAFAIAAVWLFSVVLVMPEASHPLDGLLSDYHTATGELRNIVLADGSQLLLNTNSAVSVEYDDEVRRVRLHHGQARFTVVKDSQRPFQVQAGDLNVRALGTVFEVYRPQRDEVSVTVQQHAVRVDIDRGSETGLVQNPTGDTVTIQAGQNLRYRRDGEAMVRQIDLEQASAWQQHRMLINDRPLAELIAELNRYRIGRIFLSDAQLSQLRVTGVFALDNPDDIVNAVSEVVGLRQTRLGPLWVLLHR